MCRLVPEIFEHARVPSKTVRAPRAFLRSNFVFEICGELATSHGHHGEGTCRRQRLKKISDAVIKLLQTSEHAIVLLDAEGRSVLSAAGPFRLHCHARGAPQHVY